MNVTIILFYPTNSFSPCIEYLLLLVLKIRLTFNFFFFFYLGVWGKKETVLLSDYCIIFCVVVRT